MQDRLEDLEYSDNAVFNNKEWITGNVLDSVNFLKQDKNAPPPKTKSGTVAQAMLSKVTSKEQAKELAQHAETAGAMLGSYLRGTLATMTAEAASSEIVGNVQAKTMTHQRSEGSHTARSKSTTRERGRVKGQLRVRGRSLPRNGTREEPVEASGRNVEEISCTPPTTPAQDSECRQARAGRAVVEHEVSETTSAQKDSHQTPPGSSASSDSQDALLARINKLEEENRKLQSLKHRERELDRRERELREREAKHKHEDKVQESPVNRFLLDSGIQSAVVSLVTPPKAPKGSPAKPKALPSWMNG